MRGTCFSAAASANATSTEATAWTGCPAARDDAYAFRRIGTGQRFHRTLQVLLNDIPIWRDDGTRAIEIKGISMSAGNYGTITMTNYYLEYDIASYDGRPTKDMFT